MRLYPPSYVSCVLIGLLLATAIEAWCDNRDRIDTLALDKVGNSVSVAREGRFVRLMLREAVKRPVRGDPTAPLETVLTDGAVRLDRRQASRLAELLDNAVAALGGEKQATAQLEK